MPAKKTRGRRKVFEGIVVSNKMDKTVVVRVERRVLHPKYGKYVLRSSKFMAHDEHNECQEGDLVRIMETRPLSRHKRWRVVEILQRKPQLVRTDQPELEEETLEKMIEERMQRRTTREKKAQASESQDENHTDETTTPAAPTTPDQQNPSETSPSADH